MSPPQTASPRVTTYGELRIAWDERVLEPRPWTLAQPAWLAELGTEAAAGKALELFCGAGQMGLELVRLTGRHAVLVDADAVACGYARRNSVFAGADVEVRHARIQDALEADERFALVLADPPWVVTDDVTTFPADPVLAIDGGSDGLDVARATLSVVEQHLLPGGHAVLQLGTVAQVGSLWSQESARHPGLELVGVRDHSPGGVLAHLRAVPHGPAARNR